MSYVYKNISGTTANRVLVRDVLYSGIKSLNIANTKAAGDIKADIYITYYKEPLERYRTVNLRDGQEIEAVTDGNDSSIISYTSSTSAASTEPVFYIVRNKSITNGTNLLLETLDYDTSKYDLYIKLDAEDSTADIIINVNNK